MTDNKPQIQERQKNQRQAKIKKNTLRHII